MPLVSVASTINVVVLLVVCTSTRVAVAAGDPSDDDALVTARGQHAKVKHPFISADDHGWHMAFSASVAAISEACRVVPCAQRDLYEFGVFTGRSMKVLTHMLNRSAIRTFWGFDSFAARARTSPTQSTPCL